MFFVPGLKPTLQRGTIPVCAPGLPPMGRLWGARGSNFRHPNESSTKWVSFGKEERCPRLRVAACGGPKQSDIRDDARQRAGAVCTTRRRRYFWSALAASYQRKWDSQGRNGVSPLGGSLPLFSGRPENRAAGGITRQRYRQGSDKKQPPGFSLISQRRRR